MVRTDRLRYQRIVVVSNRLPVTPQVKGKEIHFVQSPGGLATGLSALRKEIPMIWIGWPGPVPREAQKEVEKELTSASNAFPLFLPETMAERFYEGYCNRAIWPLFHSFPGYARFFASHWEAYQRANELFASKVLEHHQPGDILWVHDYHLVLLPSYIRQKLPTARIGFFLHIPFPPYEVFRLCPTHQDLLNGLLSCDLIGFHVHEYAHAFLSCVRRILGIHHTLGQLLVQDRLVQADVFPMGIDFKKYSSAPGDPTVAREVQKVTASKHGRKMIFKVSRLDYTKGIPESLDAIAEFLRRHPQWHENVQFILVVVPSRERVDKYAALKREIDERIGRINSQYSTLNWTPIRSIYRALGFSELIGLYASADVALVTPVRDGMNLIAKEYLAVRNDGSGVLILSELAGAAKELLEAIIINPNNIEEVAEAIHTALMMPSEEQVRRNEAMRCRLQSHDLHKWASRFLARFQETLEAGSELSVRILDSTILARLMEDYHRAARRLILLDYDGTLVPFAADPSGARPDGEILQTLSDLASCQENNVILLSGRDRHTLQAWLGDLPLTLVAEHGGWIRFRGKRHWMPAVSSPEEGWKREIRPILELYVERTPGSQIEEKDFSLVWHYRKAEQESARICAGELLDILCNMTENLGSVRVLPGAQSIEVRAASIGKGTFYKFFLASVHADFLLAIGDDWTDEDLFAVLPKSAYSVRVGLRLSKARFNLRSVQDVRSLLRRLGETLP